MAISTKSIIHYTDSMDKLQAILKDGFKIKYCHERLYFGNEKKQNFLQMAHPMICFCDIPFSSAKKHIQAYGEYGIGLSKEWASKKGINPVFYFEKNSLIANLIFDNAKNVREAFLAEKKDIKNHELPSDKNKNHNLPHLKSYSKNYSAELNRKDVTIDKNYNFYDEREWRLVPQKEAINNAPIAVQSKLYMNDKNKYNDKISDIRIKFEPNDISYIIVKTTSEIQDIINFLRGEYENRKDLLRELDMLISKVCSVEQIETDY